VRRRWLKSLLIGLAALLLALLLAVAWLGGTGSGLRFALGRAVVALDDKLSYASAEGSLFGGMRLRDVVYEDPAIGRYTVALVEIAPRSRRLLGGELHLTGLRLDQVEATLPPPDPDAPASTEPFALPEIRLPINVRIDELLVTGVDVRADDGATIRRIDRIEGAGHWRGAAFALERFKVLAPEGELALTAQVDTGADWAGEASVDLRGQLPGQPQPIAGRLQVSGPQARPSFVLEVVEPSPARIELDWAGTGGDARWQLRADSEDFDLAALLAEPPVQRVGFALEGHGDRDSADLSGQLRLDGYALALERLAGSWRDNELVVETLALAEADGPGRLQATGRVDFAGATPTGELSAQWQAITPPLAAPFHALDANGTIDASGTLDQLTASVQAAATVDGRPLQLAAEVEGNPNATLQVRTLTVRTGEGHLDLSGEVDLQPALAWRTQIRARRFDPGLLLPAWPGQVELDGSSEGRLTAAGEAVGTLVIDRLGGRLRGRPLSGTGTVALADAGRIDADLDLRLGGNRVDLEGRLAPAFDARLRLVLPEPELLVDGASGSAEADLTVAGSWPDLAVAGRIDGTGLAFGEHRVGTLAVELDARADLAGDNSVQLRAGDLVLAGEAIEALRLDGSGNAAANRMELEADGERGRLALALSGRWDAQASRWSGEVDALALAAAGLPEPLALDEPAALTLAPDEARLGRACLRAASSGLCLDGDWQRGRGGEFGYELTRLPLAWLLAATGERDMDVDGELAGRGRFAIDADGSVSGSGTLQAPPGRLHVPGTGRELLAWSAIDGNVELAGGRTAIDAEVALTPAGSIRARLASTAVAGGDAALDGEVDLELDDLALLDLVSADLLEPVGRVRGRLDIGGTRAAPALQGRIDLTGFGAELPALGLRLRDSQVALRAGSGNRIEVEGRLGTGADNALVLGGWFGLPLEGRVPMALTIQGADVLVADLPAARVVASPDLTVASTERGLQVRGSVAIPQARIAPEQFEAGAAAASPDVVVIDPDALPEASTGEAPVALPVYATVTVTLGDRVEIDAYGLEGRLSGELVVRERPGRPTSARGEIVVTGTYQAYGQDLDIERGRLLFTGGPIDNPLLDIRAVRRVGTVTAGLAVTGSAMRPVLEVYSVPAMDQAEALSWLVLGRPLRQATSAADQNLLGTAATAVTTAGGDLLAKALGARLGLDDVGVGNSRELGAGALTLGKYLSPKLYLGYGRSLFDGSQLVTLRYKLTGRLEAEVQSGTRENKAGLNYSYER
jgi:translocation and assembly module TamB